MIESFDMKSGFYPKLILSCLFLSIYVTNAISGQSTLQNPSFEDIPSDASTPQSWHPCAPLTTPDILPGYWGVYLEPSHGKTYVGIITRENGTFESFGQRFSTPLKANNCYFTSIDLAHSNTYTGYNQAIKLRIYLSSTKCERSQLIYESPLIDHERWRNYEIKFVPKEDFDYIIIEAFMEGRPLGHKGNILIDNLRRILPCNRV